MAVHRYWRLVEFEPNDAGMTIELSEAWLLGGTARVDAGATLTSSLPLLSGVLADLRDESTATAATFARATVLQWDFGGTPQEVTDIRLGAASDPKRFPRAVRLQHSDDGVAWTVAEGFAGILFPGARQLSQSELQPPAILSVGTMVMIANTASQITVPVPPITGRFPVTLLAAVMFRGTPGEPPAGWTKLGTAGPSTGDGGTIVQRTELYARTAYGPADVQAATFTQSNVARMIGVMLEVGASALTIEAQQSAVVSEQPVSSINLPAVAAVGPNRLGIAIGSSNYAFTGGTTLSFSAPWAIRSPAVVADNRMGLATRVLAAGETTAGTFSTDGGTTTGGNGMTAHALVAVGPMQIKRSPFPAAAVAPGVVSGPGAVPAPAVVAPLAVHRARPNYLFDPRANGRIRGTVKTKASPANLPVFCRVRLFRDVDGLLVAETWSNPVTGAYEFVYIETGRRYTVVGYDHTHSKRAVIADNLEPEVIA